jgi:hypothetical protein
MSRGLYSDPYLKALLEQAPKLAKEFLQAISTSEYVAEPEIVSCLEMPEWVVEEAGIKGFMNPNFPSKEFEKFLKDEDLVSKNIWSVFEYPNLTQKHVDKLMKNKDENVRALALAHHLGDSVELLKHLQQIVSNQSHSSYVFIYISQRVVLSDDIFAYLFSIADYEGSSRTVGQALFLNPSLSDEQKAALVLSGVQPKDDSASDYWGEDIHFVSSLPYFQALRVDLGHYKGQKFESIPTIKQSIVEFFTEQGHHLSLVLPQDTEAKIEPTLDGLYELISLELLHRLFWTELCERDDFEIYRRNAYRVDDLFISHPFLGREFEEAGSTAEESACKLGGVLMFGNQKWLVGAEDLPPDRAAHELRAYEESMVTIIEDGYYDSMGQSLVALTFTITDFAKKYGFELTENAEDWMIDAALEFAEPDSFDVSAELNPYFGETLSWSKLPDSKKETVFEFLSLGFNYKHSKLRSDSIHFLGCMALHSDTPKSLLEKLTTLKDPLIDEVLASRNR